MTWLKYIVVVLAAQASCLQASTITANLNNLLGAAASNAVVNISSPDLPEYFNGQWYLSGTAQVPSSSQLTNGQLNVTLAAPGRYNLSFFGYGTSIRIVVPADTNTYDISALSTNIFVYTMRTISPQVIASTNVVISTNLAGTPGETVTIGSVPGIFPLTNAAPVNTTTPKLWIPVTNNGVMYELPGYQ